MIEAVSSKPPLATSEVGQLPPVPAATAPRRGSFPIWGDLGLPKIKYPPIKLS